ncbi:hypothetical protein B0T18DRAFT_485660 [Schizothecium vesticola]|uniref:Uncharacterized protein n=1 Tax=Schizothecium vesticola TaxID=314040 RepID=A0AA40F490_9PEZI|nr:hypothetical protein B0T18DRAFT_485660 [Schizothecium vesticola]
MARAFDDAGDHPQPPVYSDPSVPECSDNGDGHSRCYTDADEGPRSSKTSYALTLQKACDKAIRAVKGNNIVVNSNWATPLSSAPSAIAIMAILFKVADQECAARLEVDSLEVMELDNITLRGKLPSTYFRTNLQHCSDLGRQAFLEAQHSMATIRATARSLTAEQGSIGYIIDLLEDPDTARYDLKAEIDAVTASATKCHEAAKAITAKFQYWHLVITHLKQVSLTKKGEVIKDHADYMAHEACVRKLEEETMAKARAQRDYQRALAQEALGKAIVKEDQMREGLRTACKALSDSKFQLLQAEENFSRTKLDLQRLGEKVVELGDMMTILENSSHHLGALKDQIEPLLRIFKEDLEQGIGYTAEEDVQAFLRPIQNRLKEDSGSPNDVEAFRLSKKSKDKMLSAALIMQGRFSAIGDISDAYINVSNTYIRPAISWMERLSTMPVRDWEAEKNKFLGRCEDSVGKIDGLAQRTNQNVDEHVKGSILALQRRVMEAREDDED